MRDGERDKVGELVWLATMCAPWGEPKANKEKSGLDKRRRAIAMHR